MADLIDRDALVLNVSGHVISMSVCLSKDERDGMERMFNTIMNDIQNAPAVNRWIPCSERLPEVYEKVLTYSDDGIIHDNFRLNLRDGSVGWSQGWNITHWQPRPEPPEKE